MNKTEELILSLVQSGQISADVAEDCLGEVLQQRRAKRGEPQRVAIIGVGIRLAGATTLDELTPLLEHKADMVRPFPPERRQQVLEHCSRAERERLTGLPHFEGGFLERIDLFEPALFGMPPAEARLIAPEQRLSLTVAAEALEDAGYAGGNLRESRVGVYHGRSESEYHRLLGPRDPSAVPGNISSMTASRISHHFDFHGPCLTVDTTCSSGLVALHLAREHLGQKECDVAIVGATHLILFPVDENASARIGSKSYRTKSFDAAGDGTGYGEGSICLVLKRLEDAVADADRIYAVVHGSAVNHDGRSSSITAPNLSAQKACLQAAWRTSGIDPSSLRYIEAHGTGTQVGDPIEWQALKEALADYGGGTRTCGVGSVKSNFGHLDTAAGLAGVLKLIVALRQGRFPGTVHYSRPNPHLDLEHTPLYVVQDTEDWRSGASARLAGVSSFGLSGTNCHAVVSDHVDAVAGSAVTRPLPFPLSASSPQALARLAGRCREQLLTVNPDLGAYSYSLAVRKPAEAFRVVVLAQDRAELLIKLAAVECLGDAGMDLAANGIYWRGAAGASLETNATVQRVGAWLDGDTVDWRPVYAGLSPRFCGYPRRERLEASFWSTHVEQPLAVRGVLLEQGATPAIQECLASKLNEATQLIRDVVNPASDTLQSDLREYVGQIVLRFFRECGMFTAVGIRHEKEAWFASLSLLPKYRKFYDVLLRMLQRAGYVETSQTGVWLAREVEAQNIDELCARYAARHPNLADCFEFPRYTSPYFRRVMTGQYSALRVMYPNGDLSFFQKTFTRLGDELGTYFAKVAVQGLCNFICGRLEQPFKVLEAGAGMGVLTRQLLPRLEGAENVEYWYTDIGNAFVQNARKEFEQWPFMRFSTYDISKPPADQGVADCDVVVAYNVVHTTPAIRETLLQMKAALKPGGFLFLIESAKNEDWATLSWGLLDGWWSFEDHDLRPSELMLTLEQWEQVGSECGFELVYTYPESAEQRAVVEKSIIVLGTKPGASAVVSEPRSVVRQRSSAMDRPPAHPPAELRVVASRRDDELNAQPDVEAELDGLWRSVLGLESIRRDESFYDLGGDSLLAIKLVEEVDRTLGAHIDVSDIYAFPTITQLARFITDASPRLSMTVEKRTESGAAIESILDAVLDDSLSIEGALKALGGT